MNITENTRIFSGSIKLEGRQYKYTILIEWAPNSNSVETAIIVHSKPGTIVNMITRHYVKGSEVWNALQAKKKILAEIRKEHK